MTAEAEFLCECGWVMKRKPIPLPDGHDADERVSIAHFELICHNRFCEHCGERYEAPRGRLVNLRRVEAVCASGGRC